MKTLGEKHWIKNHVSPMIIEDPTLLVGFWYHATDHGNMCKITLIVCETWWFVHWYNYIIHIQYDIHYHYPPRYIQSYTKNIIDSSWRYPTKLRWFQVPKWMFGGVISSWLSPIFALMIQFDSHLWKGCLKPPTIKRPYFTSFYLVNPPSNMVKSAWYKVFLDDQ